MIAVIVLLLATAVALALLFKLITEENHQQSTTTVAGQVVCLPHKDTSGPTTLECAIGLFSDDGRYYALRSADPSVISETGQDVVVYGTLSQPGADEVYNISGIIDVATVTNK